jgi:hypothetical protein
MLKVEGEKVKFELKEDELQGYSFNYRSINSDYAKSLKDEHELVITIDLSEMIDKNAQELNTIRSWSNMTYEDKSYYNKVTFVHKCRDLVIREISLTDAFIKEYEENVDTSTGHGLIKMSLMQRSDKKDLISILPKL